jgi:hypothetical protein
MATIECVQTSCLSSCLFPTIQLKLFILLTIIIYVLYARGWLGIVVALGKGVKIVECGGSKFKGDS